MVGADFRRVGDLLHRELFGLARGAELFGDRWHLLHLARLTRDWQSCKTTLGENHFQDNPRAGRLGCVDFTFLR
jgi:hypothetical protein